LSFLHKDEVWRKIKPIEDFFERSIISHFKFEEEIVFPTILLKDGTPKSIKLILELQREHGSILKELEYFQKIISTNIISLDEENNERLNVLGREIIDSLLTHALKEDDELVPILQKNRQIFERQDTA